MSSILDCTTRAYSTSNWPLAGARRCTRAGAHAPCFRKMGLCDMQCPVREEKLSTAELSSTVRFQEPHALVPQMLQKSLSYRSERSMTPTIMNEVENEPVENVCHLIPSNQNINEPGLARGFVWFSISRYANFLRPANKMDRRSMKEFVEIATRTVTCRCYLSGYRLAGWGSLYKNKRRIGERLKRYG